MFCGEWKQRGGRNPETERAEQLAVRRPGPPLGTAVVELSPDGVVLAANDNSKQLSWVSRPGRW